MTGRPTLPLVRPTLRMWTILRRCYRGQDPVAVLEAALILRATADGHLGAGGQIKTAPSRRAGRRP